MNTYIDPELLTTTESAMPGANPSLDIQHPPYPPGEGTMSEGKEEVDPMTLHGYDYRAEESSQDLAGLAGDESFADTPTPGGGVGGDVGRNGMPSGSKRKNEVGPDGKIKRTRQSQSCDACRARKVKCDRPPPGTTPGSESMDKCTHCRQLELDCTFDYKPKKRGPPNMYIKRMQAEQSGSPLPPTPAQRRGSSLHGPSRSAAGSGSMYVHPPVEAYVPPSGPGGTLSSQNTYGSSALAAPGQGPASTSGKHINIAWDESLHRAVAATAPKPAATAEHGQSEDMSRYTLASQQGVAGMSGPGGLSPTIPTQSFTATSPGYRHSFNYGTDHLLPATPGAAPPGPLRSPSFSSPSYAFSQGNPSNPLDQVLPRGLLLHIIDLYFDYVYPLIPAIHKPTFMADVHARREERPGEDEWTHMVLILVAATLVQVPRAFVPLPRREVRALVERCYRLTREFTAKDWEEVSVQRMTIQYLLMISSHLLGRPEVGSHYYGSQVGYILRARLNEENTYRNMPVLESELRRRLFWLTYGGERSTSAIEGYGVALAEDELGEVALPSELDDEFITECKYLEQPDERVSIISGFNYISKIFRISGQVMDRRRRDRRSPPSGVMLQMRINEVTDLYDQIMGVMDDCPEPLQLDMDNDARSVGNFSDDWDAHASADIRSLFLDPKASRAVVKDAYLVQQANIYVTQQMVRYMTLQYRDELLALQQAELNKNASTRESGPALRRQSSSRREWGRNILSEEEKDKVATDLLSILQKIPIQVIAVNSLPLVVKVRFVASTLLDALATPTAAQENPTPEQSRAIARTQRAQSYLWDFLRILSEIEALYNLADDETQAVVG